MIIMTSVTGLMFMTVTATCTCKSDRMSYIAIADLATPLQPARLS